MVVGEIDLVMRLLVAEESEPIQVFHHRGAGAGCLTWAVRALEAHEVPAGTLAGDDPVEHRGPGVADMERPIG